MKNSIFQNIKDLKKKKGRFFTLYYLVFLWNILLLLFLIGNRESLQLNDSHIELYAGTEGGLYYNTYGKDIEAISHDYKFRVHNYATHGDVENYERLVDQWSGNIMVFGTTGVTELLMKDARATSSKPLRELAIVLPINCSSKLHVFKKKSLQESEALSIWDCDRQNKLNVYLGKKKSGTFTFSKKLLELNGCSIDSLNIEYKLFQDLSFNQAADALIAGDIDMAFMFGDNDGNTTMDAVKKLQKKRILMLDYPERGSGSLANIKQMLNGDLFDIDLNGGAGGISSQSVIMTHQDTDPYIVWEFLNMIRVNPNPLRPSAENITALKSFDEGNLPLHSGTQRYRSMNFYWKFIYAIKKWIPYFALLLIILLFGGQMRQLAKINFLIQAKDKTPTGIPLSFNFKQMALLIAITISTALLLYFCG